MPVNASGLFGTALDAEVGQRQTVDAERRGAALAGRGATGGLAADAQDGTGRTPPLAGAMGAITFVRSHRVEMILVALAGALLWWAGARLVRRIRASY